MPRLPYLPAELAEPAAVVDAIRARRGGRLLHLDRMLLHSPPFARGWNALLAEVRSQLALPARLRELAICVVAVLNGADYEFFHHAPELRTAGASEAQLAALRAPERALRNADLFSPLERAVLGLTIDMTREIRVADADIAEARRLLGDAQQLVELVGVIATYNMVSRFLVALDITPEGQDAH